MIRQLRKATQSEAEQQQQQQQQQCVQEDEAEQRVLDDEAEQRVQEDEAEQITPFQHDILSLAVRETIASNVEHLNTDEIVDNIVNDLQLNGVWNMIGLGPQDKDEASIPTVDEGIALSYEIEKNDIIEDFNFDLEVDDTNIDTEYDFS